MLLDGRVFVLFWRNFGERLAHLVLHLWFVICCGWSYYRVRWWLSLAPDRLDRLLLCRIPFHKGIYFESVGTHVLLELLVVLCGVILLVLLGQHSRCHVGVKVLFVLTVFFRVLDSARRLVAVGLKRLG